MVTAVIVAILLAACGTSTASPPTTTVAVPRGWKTYTFEKAAISIPADWAVGNNDCGDYQGPVTLILGHPKGAMACPAISRSSTNTNTTIVDVASMSDTSAPTNTMVNGEPVDIGFGSPIAIQWNAPTLGVRISASGPLANRILHTLRPAT